MLFNSYPFLFVVLPVVFGVYALARLRGRFGLARGWLLLSSLVFYGIWEPSNLPILLLSIALNFVMGERLYVLSSTRHRGARALLGFAVAGNLAVLAYYKYGDFLGEIAAALLSRPFVPAGAALPLGISFFTFQQIAYHVDIYRGSAGYHRLAQPYPQDGKGIVTYALFVAFFPHLIAGPIVHPGVLIPQLRDRNRDGPSFSRLAFGATYFLVGLWKKTVLADHLSESAGLLFDGVRDGVVPGTLPCWLGALAYTFQIYFDFSGYSDMAIGLAHCFGFSLPLNFNSPYKARTIAEFWRRWHMTLSRLLREYLYIPLGGNRKGPARRYLNLLLTMGLGGLWHGAGWTFVFWGVLHGIYLCIHSLWEQGRKRLGMARPAVPRRSAVLLGQGLTFLAVVVGWVFFRSDGFRTASVIVRSLFFLGPPSNPAGAAAFSGMTDVVALGWLALGSFVAFALPNTQQWMGHRGDDQAAATAGEPPAASLVRLPRWKEGTGWAFPLGLLGALALACVSRPSVFIYFRF